jgi:hypothetical protein
MNYLNIDLDERLSKSEWKQYEWRSYHLHIEFLIRGKQSCVSK